MTSRPSIAANFVLFLAFAVSFEAHATWSIVAVDPETGEVGLAAATCNPGIQFIAAAVPGAGVVVAQAETSFKGRDQAVDWMAEGIGAEKILQGLSNPGFYSGRFHAKFPDLQYGVATLTEGPQAGYTGGDNLIPWFGGKSGPAYSVQGNTLRGEDVVADAARAFEKQDEGTCRLTLGERLLRALEAGRNAGGDKRCPLDKPALSAILITERYPTDGDGKEGLADSLRLVTPEEISLLRAAYYLIVPYHPDENATGPVKQLREKFEAARWKNCQDKTN
jgi:uncharacterized Ntn-hydrolase superfamily protein